MKNPESIGREKERGKGFLTKMRTSLNRPWESVILGSILLFAAAIKSTLAEENDTIREKPRTEMTSGERDHTFSKIQEIEIQGFSKPGKGIIEVIEKSNGNLLVIFTGQQDGDDNENFFNMELIDQGDGTFAPGEITLHEEFNNPDLDEVDLTILQSGERVLSVADKGTRIWRAIDADTGEIYVDLDWDPEAKTSQYLGDNELALSGGYSPVGWRIGDTSPEPWFVIDIDHNNADKIKYFTHVYEINGEKYMVVSATYEGNWGDLDLYEIRYNESKNQWGDMTLIYASVDDEYSMAISQTETGELGQYALHYQEEAFNPWPWKFILSRLEITPTDQDGDGVPAETDCDDSNPDIVDAQDGTCDGDSDGHIDETAMTNGGGDCDDEDPNVNPNAAENCTNSIDDDCDGATDYDDTECIHPDDIDDDGDGQTENQGDCDDGDPTTYTGANEYCDTTDHNCDGDPTNGAVDASAWYRDQDGDDYGDPNNLQEACEQPSGHVADNTDCDDEDQDVNPDADEVCTDGVDNNCDGLTDTQDAGACGDYIDNDGDGWTENEGDCDDDDPTINPDALEIDGNAVDENCDNDLGLPAEEAGGTAVWVAEGVYFEIDPETGDVKFPEGEGEAVINTDGIIELQWIQGEGILSGVSGFAPVQTTASFTWEGMNLTYENVGETPAEFIFLPTKPECD